MHFSVLRYFCGKIVYILVTFSELCVNELKVLGAMSSAILKGQRGRVTIMGFNCFRISNTKSTAQYTNTQSNTQCILDKGRKFGV